MELFTLCQRVTNLKDSIVGQTHDISWPSLIDGRLTLSHKLCRRRETQCLALTNMQIRLVALELTRAHLTERDTGTVVRIDIGSDLEDKTCKLRFLWVHVTFLSLRRTWTRSNLHEAIQQLLNTKVIQG